MKKKQSKVEKHLNAMTDVSFGNQIRTYTLSPYSLVKDHRSSFETNDAEGVLDGTLEDLIFAYLKCQPH